MIIITGVLAEWKLITHVDMYLLGILQMLCKRTEVVSLEHDVIVVELFGPNLSVVCRHYE